MKSFDTKDLKVSSRNFESSHRKDSELEESAIDFSEVSNRKFESSHRKHSEMKEPPNDFPEVSSRNFEIPIGKIQNLNAHLMQLIIPIGKILMIPNFVIQTLKVPMGKIRRLMGDLGQELLNKLILIRRISVKDILFVGNFRNWILGYDIYNHWCCQ